VIEVRTSEIYSTQGGFGSNARGQAVTVDLGQHGLMFALLRSDGDVDWAGRVMYDGLPNVPYVKGEDANAKYVDLLLNRRGRVVLPRYLSKPAGLDLSKPARLDTAPSGYTMLVRFGDIANPKSAARVDPDDLAKALVPASSCGGSPCN